MAISVISLPILETLMTSLHLSLKFMRLCYLDLRFRYITGNLADIDAVETFTVRSFLKRLIDSSGISMIGANSLIYFYDSGLYKFFLTSFL